MVRSQVLIIDENTTHQRLASLMAQRFGYAPIVVTGVEEAIEKLSSNNDLKIVLLDLGLPRTQASIRCLRALDKFRALRRADFAIIANSAHAMLEDQREGLRLGADDTLPKPYTSQEFGCMLEKWTEGKEQARLAS